MQPSRNNTNMLSYRTDRDSIEALTGENVEERLDATFKEQVLEQVKGMAAKLNAQTKQMDEQKQMLEAQTKLLKHLLHLKSTT